MAAAEDVTPGPLPSAARTVCRCASSGSPSPSTTGSRRSTLPACGLQAENSQFRSTDRIEVAEASDGGSTVTYEATLTPKGIAAAFSPLMGVVFRRIGDRAAAGLRAALAT